MKMKEKNERLPIAGVLPSDEVLGEMTEGYKRKAAVRLNETMTTIEINGNIVRVPYNCVVSIPLRNFRYTLRR